VIGLVCISIAVIGGAISGSWLDWIVIAAALGIIGMMVVVLRSYFAQERAQRLQRGLEDESASQVSEETSESVEQSFQRTVEEIRGSRLGTGGLDTLPWLMVLGLGGEGKTAMMRESGLELPAEYANRVSGAPTESCDWWLTNDAIVLDMAGRYLDSDEGETAAEWGTLLRMLRKQRPGCALNGVVFSISVDSLLGRSSSELEDVARSLRRRINEVSDELGVDLPIYLMVTKMDHVEGFVECVNAAPMVVPGEAMGWTNDQRFIADPEARVIEGFEPLIHRLEEALPELIQREPDPIRRRRIFGFPQELEDTVAAAARFVGRAFAETPYDAPPFLRGVYLSSARREGRTVSPMLHRLGHDWARTPVDGALGHVGYMLRDFFHDIVVGDRDLVLPVDRFGKTTRTAINYAAAFLFALLCTWWGISFVNNFIGINALRRESQAVTRGATSIANLDELRETIEAEQAELGVLRRGGLGGPMQTAIGRAQQTFVAAFGREFEEPTKRKLTAVVRRFDSGAFEALAQLAIDISWLTHRKEEDRGAAPDLAAYAPVSENASDVEAFTQGYDAFSRWSAHGQIQADVSLQQEVLAEAAARLLELRRLETWAEGSRSYPPVRYADSGLAGAEKVDTEVSGAYSRLAWDGLVSGLLNAIDVTGAASGKAKEFRQTYVQRYDDQWRAFLMDTPTRGSAHADVKSSPHLNHLRALHRNTDIELPRREPTPAWIEALREIMRTEALAAELAPVANEGEEPPPPEPPWQLYEAALVPVAADAEAAREDGELAIGSAAGMAARSGTSFEEALALVESLVPREGDAAAAEKLEALLEMPILDAASSVMDSAVRQLDKGWRARVVEPYSGKLTSLGLSQLYSGQGVVAEFRTGDLQPFYRDGRSTSVLGNRGMPFGPRFLKWMKSAERLQRVLDASGMGGGSISVRLQGIPGRVKNNPNMRVAERTLSLRCADGTQTFKYTEGGGRQTFKWSPDCADLSLRVIVLDAGRRRELVPAKEWRGPMAFPSFLQQATRSGNDLRWNLSYAEAGVTVSLTYRLHEGQELLSMRHEPPPKSMRN
jgi:type VI protein secretion system component VasK